VLVLVLGCCVVGVLGPVLRTLTALGDGVRASPALPVSSAHALSMLNLPCACVTTGMLLDQTVVLNCASAVGLVELSALGVSYPGAGVVSACTGLASPAFGADFASRGSVGSCSAAHAPVNIGSR
jgi:hypothetical protein